MKQEYTLTIFRDGQAKLGNELTDTYCSISTEQAIEIFNDLELSSVKNNYGDGNGNPFNDPDFVLDKPDTQVEHIYEWEFKHFDRWITLDFACWEIPQKTVANYAPEILTEVGE